MQAFPFVCKIISLHVTSSLPVKVYSTFIFIGLYQSLLQLTFPRQILVYIISVLLIYSTDYPCWFSFCFLLERIHSARTIQDVNPLQT